MVFPESNKWWVADLRDIVGGSESEIRNKIRERRHEFTYNWIVKREFEPKVTRYEAVMTALGFNMIFRAEQHVFSNILKTTKDFIEGRLRPAKREISEKEHQEETNPGSGLHI